MSVIKIKVLSFIHVFISGRCGEVLACLCVQREEYTHVLKFEKKESSQVLILLQESKGLAFLHKQRMYKILLVNIFFNYVFYFYGRF